MGLALLLDSQLLKGKGSVLVLFAFPEAVTERGSVCVSPLPCLPDGSTYLTISEISRLTSAALVPGTA